MVGITEKSLEEFVEIFYKRYEEEPTFQLKVQDYLRLSVWQMMRMGLCRTFWKSRYQKQTRDVCTQYANVVYDGIQKKKVLQEQLKDLEKSEQMLVHQAGEVNAKELALEVSQSEYDKARHEEEIKVQEINTKFQSAAEQEAQQYEEKEDKVAQQNAETLVKEALRGHILTSGLVKAEDGVLMWDEQGIAAKLEEIFLKDIVLEIEKEDGSGFLSRSKREFTSTIESWWGDIEDISELSEVDWIESAFESIAHGYKRPTLPYLIAPKYEDEKRWAASKASIDTAVIVDSSGSMDDRKKWEMAQKAALATSALMRKLSPKNETFLAHYNDSVYPCSSLDLRKVNAKGGTRTELALDWMRQKLENRGPTIAVLITDGEPNDLEITIEAAKKYRELPTSLWIYLVDGNSETISNIRKIGKAAGQRTRVIPVKDYQLGNQVVRNISKAIGELRNIENF